jgi:hypothetical protein
VISAETDPSVSPSEPPLSQRLVGLSVAFANKPARLCDVITALEGRAYALLMILCALPFVPPVSVPGSSTPLGLIVAVIAVQLALGRLPWLPRRVLNWTLPMGFFAKLVAVTLRIVKAIERFLHPRWPALTATAWLRGCHLVMITIAGLLLALPIIFPFTNMLPGWTIVLLACGLLERDGIMIAVGYVVMLLTLAFFIGLAIGGTEAMHKVWAWLFE